MPHTFGIIHALKRAVSIFPNQEILASDGRTTYKKLYEDSLRIASFLRREGIGDGDVIAVFDFNTLRYVSLIYAASLVNAIVYPVNFRTSYSFIKRTFDIAKPKAVFCSRPFESLMEMLNVNYFSLENYTEWVRSNEPIFAAPDIKSDFALFFNDDEENLRGILYSQYHFPSLTLSMISQLSIANPSMLMNHTDAILSLININNVFSWGSIFFAPLIGAKLVLVDTFSPDYIFRLIENEGITFILAVPKMMQSLVRERSNLGNLKALIGGGLISPRLDADLRSAGVNYIYIYGSELLLALGVSMNRGKSEKGREPNKVYPLPFVEMKIIKDDFQEANINEPGEIVCKSVWIPKIFYSSEKNLYFDGWYRTGDLGLKKEDGGIVYLGKINKAMKEGRNFIPTYYLENLIRDVANNAEVSFTAVYDENYGKRPVAILKGRNIDVSEVWNYLHYNSRVGRIDKSWLPLNIVVLDRKLKSYPETEYIERLNNRKIKQ